LPAELRSHLKAREEEFRIKYPNAIGSSSPVQMENWHDYLMIANITVGTPPQTVRVGLTYDAVDLYVIGVGAKEVDSSESDSDEASLTSSALISTSISDEEVDIERGDNTTRPAKNTYDASASSTFTPQNGDFYENSHGQVYGSLANDIVNLGGLDLNVTFGDISEYDYYMGDLPIDGMLGIAPAPSSNGMPSVLQQIVGQLSKPLVVLNTRRNYEAYEQDEEDPSEVNEITFGTDTVEGCGAEWSWFTTDALTNNTEWASLNTSYVHIEAGADGCEKGLAVSHQLYIRDFFRTMYCSHQVQELLVQASGAQYDSGNWIYEVECDKVAEAKNVIVSLANGGSITLTPNDYIGQIKSKCYLNSIGFYDERDAENNDWYGLVLGQQFANNHCIAYNIAENLVGISDKTSSSASSNSVRQPKL